MPDPADQRVTCPYCGKAYRWLEKLVGRPVDCKKCDKRFEVAPEPGPGIAAEQPPPPQDESNGLYDLNLDQTPEAKTPTLAAPAVNGKCPKCNAKVAHTAVLCLNCGFNMQEGKSLKPEVAELSIQERKKEARPQLSGMRLVQVGLLLHLVSILITLGSMILPLLGIVFDVAELLLDISIIIAAGLSLVGTVLCLGAPKGSGGRPWLIASLSFTVASFTLEMLIEIADFNDWWMLLSAFLSYAATISFLYFFVQLARYLDFDQITEQAEKLLGIYILITLGSMLLWLPIIGCLTAILVLGAAIYALILYIHLLIDLNNAVNYRLNEES